MILTADIIGTHFFYYYDFEHIDFRYILFVLLLQARVGTC